MAREERRDDPNGAIARDVRGRAQPREHHVGDAPRRRLKVLPEQEEPHAVTARVTYEREVARDLIGIEPAPEPHRGTRGPVVHADVERRGHATRAPARTRSY